MGENDEKRYEEFNFLIILHSTKELLPAKAHTIYHLTIIKHALRYIKLGAILANAKIDFSKKHNIIPWDIEFFQRLPNDEFTFTVGVYVCLYKIINLESSADHIRSLAVSHVLIPALYACSRIDREASSSNVQSCQSGLPKDIVPRMIFDTFSPEVPSLK